MVAINAPRAIQIFICNPCGIRFSSLSTLDAHQTYYCSRRHKKDPESDEMKLPTVVIESDEMAMGNDTDSCPSSVEPSNKSVRTGKQYKCPHCNYSADKKVSLNRHMRMHSISPVPSIQSPPCLTDGAAADPSAVDRYCQNCDIRFSNQRTYQAHKTHYCNTRHVVKPMPPISPMPNNTSSPTSIVPTYLALPTNPIIVVPYALVQNASVLPALSDVVPSPPTDTACILLSDGTLQPIAQAFMPTKFNAIAKNINNNNNNNNSSNNNNNNNNNNTSIHRNNSQSPPEVFFSPPKKVEIVNHQEVKRPIAQSSSPLDLRLNRVAKPSHDISTDGEEEKENRLSDGNITDAEDIVCAPSIPCMILSPSSSPPSGNKTPQQRSVVQPPINGIIQKPQTLEVFDGPERNGKFSVSSLLHMTNKLENMKQESVGEVQPPPAVVQRYNMQMHHKSRNVVVPTGPVLPSGIMQRNDLLNQGGLPYFTSEMTLRLATNPVPDSIPTTHQFFLKQGPSKCESCNIVFCKYENFLAHKKHYCASRPPQNDVDDADKTSPEGSPGPKPLTVTSPQSSKDSVSPTPTLKPPMIQFICSTCGVKFSSFDNLTTHQSFYCPNRMTGTQDQADKSLLHLKACPKCKMSVIEGSHHQCQAANCWKCPVCGAVRTTASAAQKHLDNHNGIKAFMCTICQYKGNTLRGLRTHIRMHFNKRLIPDLMVS
ncbi:Hypothetical protein CINCED_3A005310 [Cinara cedri]|uniref:Zinc finger C2H2-type n=1 Tax=Cinara cedri TaxID=506608 RepID=A0A5E4NJV7_9HEMI|nr:Hypothetical protein CINCED_3A005310 [Cinara cedri]